MSDEPPVKPEIEENGKQLSLVAPQPLMIRPSVGARALESIIPGRGKLLLFCWLLAALALALIFGSLQNATTRFYGIAESQTRSVSFQYPVEIVTVPVVAGQQVEKASRLLQVKRFDLEIKRAVIEDKVSEISAQRASLKRAIAADIERLDGERLAATEALTTKIENLATRYRLNRRLAGSLSPETAEPTAPDENPMLVHIDGLKAERRQIENLYQARVSRLRKELQQKQDPDTARLAELQKQKQELARQSQALSIVAPFDGSVGSIAFKPGEQVEAFREVMSVIGSSTRQIKAYIHEAVVHEARIGQTVWVQPLDANGTDLEFSGRIVSMGNRIVEYPARLKRNPLVSAWGREVIVEVEADTDLLVGEKVAVLLTRPEPIVDRVIAQMDRFLPISSVLAKVSALPAALVISPSALIEISIDPASIEASGLVVSAGAGGFYLVSDEHAAVFEVDARGEVQASIELPPKLDLDDIESISHDGGWYYLLSSLSAKKSGRSDSRRHRIARLEIAGGGIESLQSTDLYQVLQQLRQETDSGGELKRFLDAASLPENLEIEAQRVVGDNLFLGFKKPFNRDGLVTLLKLEGVNALFAGGAVEANIWHQLDLRHPVTRQVTRLTDFDIGHRGLYLLSVGRDDGKVTSLIWHYDFALKRLHLLTCYEALIAEGISVNAAENLATIVFDGGGKSPSRMASLEI